ncbi:MDR family MFS transporter [Adlercreutzia sp. ZJ304]|uniref:MDR family MFS transporter n=1 Tax=Adlercreutzia sp. ZJ304 TaxID=2709791 RepID=UPI0013EBDC6A|nr:MDR family MFS transporter [Adlercreutzia sp. ZJ304]
MGLTRKQWFMLIALVVGTFVTVLNQTLITPALPSIMTEMGIDAPTGQWLTTGFTLVNAIMIPITAYLQDRFSTRRLFLFSMIVFAVGTALCGWAPNFPVLLGGRLVQAAGAGILMPLSMTVLLVTFPIERRGSAMGIFGLVIAFAPAIGPTVAGIVIDIADWHIMFVGILVLVMLVIVASIFLMEGRPPANKGDSALDPLSLILSTAGFGGLLYGFSVFGSSGLNAISVAITAVGIICVVWFFVRQTKLDVPMLRVKVLANRKFLIATIIGMLVQGSLLAAGILMPIYVQTLMGYSATMSGLVLMPGAILMGIMNPVAGKLFDKHGPRMLGIVGMVLLFITTIGFGLLTLESSLVYITLLYMVRMVSMALVNMPITTWGMNALDTRYINHGTSVNNTLRQVAGSIGTAMVISVSAMVTNASQSAVGSTQANMYGINIAFMACALLVLIGLVLTVIFVKGKPGETAPVGVEDEEKAATSQKGTAVLRDLMKRDVFTLPSNATVQQAVQLFIDKGISACPIIDENGQAAGFISDGDILKQLSRRSGSYIDPIVLIAMSATDESTYSDKLQKVMQLPVSAVGVRESISVNVHADLEEVCRVLSQNHLKKVPVLEDGHIVGIINRSDITRYSMEEYVRSVLPSEEQ